MVRGRLAALLIAAAVAAAATAPGAQAAAVHGDSSPARRVDLVVIVRSDAPVTTLSKDAVRRIYLLRTRFWRGGARIAPANISPSSPLRDAFSRAVLGQSTRDLATFWNDLYFHGTLPPPSVESESAMLLYVSRTPGAIGYVSRDALMADTSDVRVVLSVAANVP